MCCEQRTPSKGVNIGAFFNASSRHFLARLTVIICLSPGPSTAFAVNASCPARQIDHVAIVKTVIDGDTLILTDQTRVRLIGINAPERRRHSHAAEPFAEQARNYLKQRLESSRNRIKLQFGTQKRDRYGRLLAHVFLPNGEDLGASLLRQGLAMQVALPPNLHAISCYQRHENAARKTSKALWSTLAVKKIHSLPPRKGFYFGGGRVTQLIKSATHYLIILNNKLAVKIPRRDLKYFTRIRFKQLIDKEIRVRGWVYKRYNRYFMRVRHSSMLEIMK